MVDISNIFGEAGLTQRLSIGHSAQGGVDNALTNLLYYKEIKQL
jgi:hypothetical protein